MVGRAGPFWFSGNGQFTYCLLCFELQSYKMNMGFFFSFVLFLAFVCGAFI